MKTMSDPVVILGGGLAGLASADILSDLGVPFVLLEKNDFFGGLTPTIQFEGCYFELGPHIYFKASEEVDLYWKGLGGEKFREHRRQTKLYYQGRFINSPFKIADALRNIGFFKLLKMVWSYVYHQFQWGREELNARDWVVSRYGSELFENFFKVYNEKIWGIPCEKIDPRWTEQRVKTSLLKIIYDTLFRERGMIVKGFNFPDGGSKVLIDALVKRIESRGVGRLLRNAEVVDVGLDDEGRIPHIGIRNFYGLESVRPSKVISTIPLHSLISMLRTEVPSEVMEALKGLRYRDLVMVAIVVDYAAVKNFQEHWIDIHDPEVRALRVTNYANYLGAGLVQEGKAALSVEYNVFEKDAISILDDDAVIEQARKDLDRMKVLSYEMPAKAKVIRVKHAYPLYSIGFVERVNKVHSWLKRVENLIVTGRHGLFKWNNMHHSIQTGQLAARMAALGESYDLMALRSSV